MVDVGLSRSAGCGDEFDPRSLSVAAALGRIEGFVEPIADTEQVAVRHALGRVLAHDVCSPIDVPQATNSAMDGYALIGAALPASGTRSFSMIGTSWAGRPFPQTVAAGQCVRIMTGGILPPGTDTVVMQEQVTETDGEIGIGPGHRPGQYVRYAGEDLARGDCALGAGRRITPADLGLAASLGLAELRVVRKPRVAFLSTGDELRTVGEPLGEGEVYDSNRYTLYGMLTQIGVDFIDLGVVRDDKAELHAALAGAARVSDAVITSAGASVGEADFIKEVLDEIGEVNFWKVAMKPGRPLAFGKIGRSLFFGLPGNPVSVMVTFYQFVQPALHRLMGLQRPGPLRLKARTVDRLTKRPGRVEYQRGVLVSAKDGELRVHSTGVQGSGVLSSMSRADCFIVLPADSAEVDAGTIVDVEPFSDFV
jgi:molybdopterin molybdotransferase